MLLFRGVNHFGFWDISSTGFSAEDCLNWADIASALALPLRISIVPRSKMVMCFHGEGVNGDFLWYWYLVRFLCIHFVSIWSIYSIYKYIREFQSKTSLLPCLYLRLSIYITISYCIYIYIFTYTSIFSLLCTAQYSHSITDPRSFFLDGKSSASEDMFSTVPLGWSSFSKVWDKPTNYSTCMLINASFHQTPSANLAYPS